MAIFELPWPLLVTICAVTCFAALVQATTAFGFAILSVPILSLIDPRLAPVPQLMVQIPLSILIWYHEREHADWRAIGWTTLGRIPGTIAGAFMLVIASKATLDISIGTLVLAGVLLIGFGRSVKRTPLSEFIAGGFSGLGAIVASIGGPPLALLYKDDKGPTIRATVALIFIVGLVLTFIGRFAAGAIGWLDVQLGLLILPFMWLGTRLASLLHERIEGPPLRNTILGLAALAGILLLAEGLSLLF